MKTRKCLWCKEEYPYRKYKKFCDKWCRSWGEAMGLVKTPIRIYNPVTRSYYKIRQRDTSAGNKGSIIGKWKPSS